MTRPSDSEERGEPKSERCPTCGRDATAMKQSLDDLVMAARNHWGAGSEQHNLVRDVSDAILRAATRAPKNWMPLPPPPNTKESSHG